MSGCWPSTITSRKLGGVTADGSKMLAYILRADGTSDAYYMKVKNMQPGDTIVVPIKIEPRTHPIPFWTAVATVFTGLVSATVAALAVVAIGRQ